MIRLTIYLISVFIFAVAFFVNFYASRHWRSAVIDPDDFIHSAKNFTQLQIPTVHYKKGELSTLLPEFFDGFKLFRLEENEEAFNIEEILELNDSPITTNKVLNI